MGSLLFRGLSPVNPPRKVRLKRSYLLLSWFSYLFNFSPIESYSPPHSSNLPKLTMLPATRSLYTFTKAPMAHKTRSKEQFMFRFYSFKFSKGVTTAPSFLPRSVNCSLSVFFLIKKSFPLFETNLLFLKFYQINVAFFDSNYFNFYKFISA